MRKLSSAALCAAVLVSACKIERTPPEFVDHRQPVTELRDAASEELQARLLALGQALARGDASEAALALVPAADAYVLTPQDSLAGEEAVGALIGRLAAEGGEGARVEDVVVSVGPRANVAWFRGTVHLPRAEIPALRLTGVFLRADEGEWRLVQAHLSSPTPEPSPPQANPDAAADSLAGE